MIVRTICIAIAICLAVPVVSFADINKDKRGVAIKGYDSVAYFVDDAAVQGKEEYSYEWMGATWYFAKPIHRDMFIENPTKYAPQYGGYCAYAMSKGSKANIDPHAFSVVDDKLYLNFNKSVRSLWISGKNVFI